MLDGLGVAHHPQGQVWAALTRHLGGRGAGITYREWDAKRSSKANIGLFSDMFEPMCQMPVNKSEWMCMYREATGTLENPWRHLINGRRRDPMIAKHRPSMLPKISHKKRLGDCGQKKVVLFAKIPQVKGSKTNRVVFGPRLPDAVSYEESLRNPCTVPTCPSRGTQTAGPPCAWYRSSTKRGLACKAQLDNQRVRRRHWEGVLYPFRMQEPAHTVKDKKAWTATMDGFGPLLATAFGLHALALVGPMLVAPVAGLSPEVHKTPLSPMVKKPGDN